MPEIKPQMETFAKIKVLGIGGSGNSIVDRMISSGMRGVEFCVMNTDVQALHHNSAENKIHIGKKVTKGLGSGMDPEVGMKSAEESEEEIREELQDTDMAFVTCGLGGGTGSGASPVVARIAKDMDVLTVGVVTKPFGWEGPRRMDIAKEANERLAEHVDTIITIPNDKILKVIDKNTSLVDAFGIVDDVLRQGVQGISELITVPGLINVDFADVKTIMSEKGSALMGIGSGEGKSRAIEAAEQAVSSPLLELSIDGAQGILFSITGGKNLGMQEVSEAAQVVTKSAGDNAEVIFGAVIDEDLDDEVYITVVATGFEEGSAQDTSMSNKNQDKTRDRKSLSFSPDRNKKKHSKSSKDKASQSSQKEQTQSKNKKKNPKKEKNDKINESRPSFKQKTVDSSDSETETKTKTNTQQKQSQTKEQSKPNEKNVSSENSNPDSDQEEDEDLEIPAFIRKKMGM